MNFVQLVSVVRRCAGVPWICAMAACGGGGEEVGDAQLSAQQQATAAIVAPLIHDDGSLHIGEPRARPQDAGAWTASGRYASEAQARMLVEALGDGVLQIDVDCCSPQAADVAASIAWGLQAAGNLPDHTPVLVRGTDLRLAAAAANRLATGGLTRVWLVTTH